MKKISLILAIVILLLGGAAIFWHSQKEEDESEIYAARMRQIRELVNLTTLEFHEEFTIKDSVNGKWLVARETVDGAVRFDLDSLDMEMKGDSLIVRLPAPRYDVYESAASGAYQVLDSWDARRTLIPRTLTAREENLVKSRWKDRLVARLESRGYGERARRNAVATLEPILERMSGVRVRVE